MKIKPFKLERYFAKYEFSAPYLLSCSDCEPLTLKELLAMADPASLKLWTELSLGYTESPGHPLLRTEIAKLYTHISPTEILTCVPEEGVFMAMHNILAKGDHIVTTFPGYQSLYEIAYSVGCTVSKWQPRCDKGWNFDLADLKDLITKRTKLLVINFPHNPTGATLSKDQLEDLIKIAKRNNIFIFSDEMYRGLEYEESQQLASVSDLYENGISLFGMSKTFALAGLRIGWLTTKNKKLFKTLAAFKDYTTICSSAPSEILAIMALRAKDHIIKRNLSIMQINLNILGKFFQKYRDFFVWHKPKAGPITFPELKLKQNVADFCLDLVQEKGVMLLPAKVYDYQGNNFRIGFARQDMPAALQKFEEYLKSRLG